MKQTKCKMAFVGRWLHNRDVVKCRSLQEQLTKKYALNQSKKLKLEKAGIMLEKAKSSASLQNSNAYVVQSSSEVVTGTSGETQALTNGQNKNYFKTYQLGGAGLSLSANKKRHTYILKIGVLIAFKLVSVIIQTVYIFQVYCTSYIAVVLIGQTYVNLLL